MLGTVMRMVMEVSTFMITFRLLEITEAKASIMPEMMEE